MTELQIDASEVTQKTPVLPRTLTLVPPAGHKSMSRGDGLEVIVKVGVGVAGSGEVVGFEEGGAN
jgi:hypothetical protein